MSGEGKGKADFSATTEYLSPRQNLVNNEVAVSDRGGMGDGNESSVSPRGKQNSWFRSEETNDPEILLPDHPLMKRFQNILKAHLERENQELKEEVAELSANLKEKMNMREDLGEGLTRLQQEMKKQESLLSTAHKSLEKFMRMREEIEGNVTTSKKKHETEAEKLKSAQKKEEELQSELESLILLERQFAEWQAEMESDLAVSQRISEKTKLEKKLLAEEKRKQDIFLLKLTTEVGNLETQITNLEGQFRIKEMEREMVSQTVADANADLEALSREQRRLLQSWNSVIISMQQRDKAYDGINKEKSAVSESILLLEHEFEAYKKIANSEMQKNEVLTGVYQKLLMDCAFHERQENILDEKRMAVEEQLSSTMNMLEYTEKELEKIVKEGAKMAYDTSCVSQDVDKLLTEKNNTEDKILEKMEEQVTHDKASNVIQKAMRHLREKVRSQEFLVVAAENQISKAELTLEEHRGDLLKGNHHLTDIRKELQKQEKEVEDLVANLERCKSKVGKSECQVDMLNRQLEYLILKSGGDEISPMQQKIANLQIATEEIGQKAEDLRQTWLRQQSRIVQLSKQRNEQHHQLNILRRQITILKQKNMTIENDIEKFVQDDKSKCRSINTLLSRLETLNQKLSNQKGYKETLNLENALTEVDYVNTLKEAEGMSYQLEEEIIETEKEINCLILQLADTQKEALAWNKKLQMAIEAKQTIDKERSKSGEVYAMKNEIHKMQIRHNQLCRAQEKLITDLEHCVTRRESIVSKAKVREKRSSTCVHNSRVNFQRKLEDLQTKIKKAIADTKKTEVLIEKAKKSQEGILDKLSDKQNQLKKLEELSKEVDRQLQEGRLMKQQNLELLIRRQRRARMYSEVKQGKHRLLYRTEHALDSELVRQRTVNSDLISVLESLLTDFPSLAFDITKILNTLRSLS